MNDRFNATTGSSARRSEVHPATEGHRIDGSHQGPAISKKDAIATMSNHTTYTVAGMTCAHCVASVTEEVSEIPGVGNVQVDLASGAVVVTSKTWQNGQTVT
jgi:copper chaperone CopZ